MTTSREYRPSPLAPVELTTDGERWSLVFVREFPQPPKSVWAALTEPDELRQWAPFTASRPLDSVGPATISMIDGPDSAELDGTVTVADPPHHLAYAWGDDLLSWELAESGGGTRLTLTHRLADRGYGAMMAAGWHICLDVAAELLAGSPIGPIVGESAMDHGWADLNAQYSARLGVDARNPG